MLSGRRRWHGLAWKIISILPWDQKSLGNRWKKAAINLTKTDQKPRLDSTVYTLHTTILLVMHIRWTQSGIMHSYTMYLFPSLRQMLFLWEEYFWHCNFSTIYCMESFYTESWSIFLMWMVTDWVQWCNAFLMRWVKKLVCVMWWCEGNPNKHHVPKSIPWDNRVTRIA